MELVVFHVQVSIGLTRKTLGTFVYSLGKPCNLIVGWCLMYELLYEFQVI